MDPTSHNCSVSEATCYLFALRARDVALFATIQLHTMSAPPRKTNKVPGTIPTLPSTPSSSTAHAEGKALGKAVADGYTRTLDLIKAASRVVNQWSFVFVGLPLRTRLIFGVAVGLVGLTGLYLQPVLHRFKLDKGTAQRHREIVDEERKRQRGSKVS